MANDSGHLTAQHDPIADKLADEDAMLRAAQHAVTTALENARKLGVLDHNYTPINK